MNNKVGLVFGTETGNTEHIAELIQKEWGDGEIEESKNIFDIDLDYFDQFNVLILGIPSWYDGQLQGDWEAIFDDLDEVNFKNKAVAIYGLGDQQDWGDYFVDALGELAQKIQGLGATLIGEWSKDGYEFLESKAINADGNFYGLVLDEDWQPELSEERVQKWIVQLKAELKDIQLMNVA